MSYSPVISVVAHEDHTLSVVFRDGKAGIVDMAGLIKEKPWRALENPVLFAQGEALYGTVVWPGNIDVAPEYLYEHCA